MDGGSKSVAGILFVKKILPFLAPHEEGMERRFSLRRLIEPAVSITKKTKLHNLFKMLKRLKQHMAIVVDEHGDMIGLVTFEDLLEELFGEIYDERDIK